MQTIRTLALIGLFLSVYAYNVKKQAEKNKNYKPLCDISKNISCTKAFTSKYVNLTPISNMVWGVLFYTIIYVLAGKSLTTYIQILAIPAVIASIYLAYVSYIKQKNFCLVCTGVYVINILILWFSFQ
jgi:uncharacterized membrane protein